ncbi:MAG TPA: LruC domain-containing protein [Polyangiaceae bacterium]|jgi:LruC domain-containing protein|nr:LruC domain-containing protein [Polyangiaceae bacterium]
MNIRHGLVSKTCAALLAAFTLLSPGRSFATDIDTDGTPDETDAVPCDPRATSVAFAPAENQMGALVFEDMWPATGDLDFNDVVLDYNYIFFLDGTGKVVALQASINLMAAGGTIPNSVHLHLPVASDAASVIRLNGADGVMHDLTPQTGEHELVLPLIDDVGQALGGQLVNTTTEVGTTPAVPLNLYIQFATPQALDRATAPFDLYLERVNEPGHQIHQVSYPGTDTMDQSLFGTEQDGSTTTRHFVDRDGLPFALAVPATFQWPQEDVMISTAYPDITAWVESGGASHTDWYNTDVQTASVWTGGANGSPPPIAALLGPTDPSEDTKCAPWKGTAEFGVGPDSQAFAVTSDTNGNIVSAGIETLNSGGEAALVTKYDASKNQLWSQTLTASGQAQGYGVVTDAQGNVYVSGQVQGTFAGEPSLASEDAFVTKLDPSGTVLWTRHLGSSGVQFFGWGITIAPDGTIDTTGYGNGRPFVGQLDADGNVLRFVSVPIPLNTFGIATDAAGNMYLNGYSGEVGLAKLSPQGALIWTQTAPSFGLQSFSEFNSVGVDAQGNAYETGVIRQESCFTVCQSCGLSCTNCFPECFFNDMPEVWKFDGSGHNLWQRNLPLANADSFGLALDHEGNAIASGYDANSAAAFSTKLTPTGAVAWTREEGANFSEGLAACVDPSDSVFIAGVTNLNLSGTSNAMPGIYQAFISKYDDNGVQQ